ncbi:MAG: hypothetical protein IOC49_07590 [Methylobacterium sp.]|jgi:hypothetical protein|nr:hypothetical protein [Methylobacterium sp.]
MSTPENRCNSETDLARLTILLDCLIPGDAKRWPAFSKAVPVADILEGLEEALRANLTRWLAALDNLRPEVTIRAIAAFERAEPLDFARLLTVVHRAYYTAPAVLDIIRTLADSGPREASPLFDPSLVQRVLATKAGQRRL